MPEGFASAATRHLDDAELLLTENRPDNAAYLAGYVAECALKVLLVHSAFSARRFGHDLGILTTDALQMLWLIAPALRRYSLPDDADFRNLVRHWNSELRYSVTGAQTHTIAQCWVRGATCIFRSVIAKSVLDGGSRLQ